MKNILVPIDFSEHSNYAVEVAVDLAKKNGATILLLHCVELPRRFVTESTSALPEELFFMREAGLNVKQRCCCKDSSRNHSSHLCGKALT